VGLAIIADKLGSLEDGDEAVIISVEVADGDDLVDARPDARPAGGGRRRWR